MHLWAQGIRDNDDSVGRVRQARGLSEDDRNVGRGRGIYDRPEDSMTMTGASAEEDEHKDYNDKNGCVGGG